jgi:hypothetical protein
MRLICKTTLKATLRSLKLKAGLLLCDNLHPLLIGSDFEIFLFLFCKFLAVLENEIIGHSFVALFGLEIT